MNPGKTTRPRASTISVSALISVSISSVLPTRSINPSRTNIPPFEMMPSSRSSRPTRGRDGPASVTSSAPIRASVLLSSFSEDMNRDADSIRYQHCGDNLQRKQQRTSNFRNRNDRKANVNQSDDKTRRASELEPPRRSDAKRLHSKQRNRKQREVSDRVKN